MPAGREVISVRVSRETGAAIDAARGPDSRARWVGGLIADALNQVPTAATDSKDIAAPTVIAEPRKATVPNAPTETNDRTAPCPHPRARVIKGFCYRCGRMV